MLKAMLDWTNSKEHKGAAFTVTLSALPVDDDNDDDDLLVKGKVVAYGDGWIAIDASPKNGSRPNSRMYINEAHVVRAWINWTG